VQLWFSLLAEFPQSSFRNVHSLRICAYASNNVSCLPSLLFRGAFYFKPMVLQALHAKYCADPSTGMVLRADERARAKVFRRVAASVPACRRERHPAARASLRSSKPYGKACA
jgi:hypothetical protein